MKKWFSLFSRTTFLLAFLVFPSCYTVYTGDQGCIIYRRFPGNNQVAYITGSFKTQLFSQYIHIHGKFKNEKGTVEPSFLMIPRESLLYLGDGYLCDLNANGEPKFIEPASTPESSSSDSSSDTDSTKSGQTL